MNGIDSTVFKDVMGDNVEVLEQCISSDNNVTENSCDRKFFVIENDFVYS